MLEILINIPFLKFIIDSSVHFHNIYILKLLRYKVDISLQFQIYICNVEMTKTYSWGIRNLWIYFHLNAYIDFLVPQKLLHCNRHMFFTFSFLWFSFFESAARLLREKDYIASSWPFKKTIGLSGLQNIWDQIWARQPLGIAFI